MQFNALNRLMSARLLAAVLAANLLLLPFQVIAKGEETVQGVMEQFRIVRLSDGNESRVAAQNVKPGETLEYSVRYTNKGSGPVNQLMVTLPIPRGLELVAQTDQPRAALASLDGIAFDAIPLKRRAKQPDGREVLEEVPLTEYRALRWQVGQLGSGKTVQFVARAKVDATASVQSLSLPVGSNTNSPQPNRE